MTDSGGKLQVGFRDMVDFGVGLAVPMLLTMTALLIAVSVSAGAGAGPGITAGMMTGLIFSLGLEMLRRLVLLSRPRGELTIVRIFRGLIWLILLGTPVVMLFVAAGVFSSCYGRGCDTLSSIVMKAMLGMSIVAVLLLPIGYRLLQKAVWLQPLSD